ncbi:MAG: hypothetical protein ACUVYA_13115 [Planctomycetota bacterium]|mgnify:CR=1 FL=1
MRTRTSDTSPEARAVIVQLARTLSPARKLALAASMASAVRELARAGVRSRNPGLDEAALRRRLAAVLLPPEIAAAAYGWSPTEDGY